MMSLKTILLLLLPTSTWSCGGFFCQLSAPVVQSGEAIVFGVDGNNVTMHVQIQYEGPAEGFSWVLPLPFQPATISVGSEQLFTALFSTTLPQFVLDIQLIETETCTEDDLIPAFFPCAAESSSGGMMPQAGATILEEGSVGPFDYVIKLLILEAADNDPSSVFRWLEEHGYD